MKKYNIYGLGNALVDTEIQISDEECKKLKLEKGVMTLIQPQQLEVLTEHFKHHTSHLACGGSAANTIITATQFGADCFYSCKVSKDANGLFYLEDLIKEGVTTNLHPHNLEEGQSGTCLILITPDAERTMLTFLGSSASFSDLNLDLSAVKESDYVYIEGYLVTSPTGLKAAITARQTAEENNVKTAFTFSDPNIVNFFKANINAILGESQLDILFCNKAEALSFTEKDTLTDAVPLLKEKAKTVVITLGKKGAIIHTGTETITIPSYPTQAIDSNGAGDTFAGAFLARLSQHKSLEDAGHFASQAAALVVSKFGPRLGKTEVDQLYASA